MVPAQRVVRNHRVVHRALGDWPLHRKLAVTWRCVS